MTKETLTTIYSRKHKSAGVQINVLKCFNSFGPDPIKFYDGPLKSQGYANTIKDSLPFVIVASFDLEIDLWYVQHDNALCHRTRVTLKWFDGNEIHMLDWPPSSHDLNQSKIFDQSLVES
jgi:hypothetical protein